MKVRSLFRIAPRAGLGRPLLLLSPGGTPNRSKAERSLRSEPQGSLGFGVAVGSATEQVGWEGRVSVDALRGLQIIQADELDRNGNKPNRVGISGVGWFPHFRFQ